MRTVLYANRLLSQFLQDNYVLLWSSERPVPKVTIDFGDGRTMERTITGNAVHYVLDGRGRPLDAIPGLYEPATFKEVLERARLLHTALKGKPQAEHSRLLQLFHKARAVTLESAFASAVRGAEFVPPMRASPVPEFVLGDDSVRRTMARDAAEFQPDDQPFIDRVAQFQAERAVAVARGKSAIEVPLLTSFRRFETVQLAGLAESLGWRRIAAGQLGNIELDNRSLVLMARELPGYADTVLDPRDLSRLSAAVNPFSAEKAVRLATSKLSGGELRLISKLAPLETSLVKLASRFLETLAEDTVRNEFTLHVQVHNWMAEGSFDLDALNERVYRELFLTPRSDPWLGLAPEAYSGIDGGGRSQP